MEFTVRRTPEVRPLHDVRTARAICPTRLLRRDPPVDLEHVEQDQAKYANCACGMPFPSHPKLQKRMLSFEKSFDEIRSQLPFLAQPKQIA